MNKEINFSRFVGIAIVIICIIIVVLALMSAIVQNENANNIIYVDYGSGTTLSIPKSNVVSHYVDMQKDIQTDNGTVALNIKLPKINIETETVNNINENIYSIYQEAYSDISNTKNIQKIDVNYTYDYLDDDTVLEIVITKKITVDGKEENAITKFRYDIVKDDYVVV